MRLPVGGNNAGVDGYRVESRILSYEGPYGVATVALEPLQPDPERQGKRRIRPYSRRWTVASNLPALH